MGRLDIRDPPREEDQPPGGGNYGISLTPLELECLKAMAEGEPVAETAARLHYSKHHIYGVRKEGVLRKLNANNAALAVRRGFEYGFLT